MEKLEQCVKTTSLADFTLCLVIFTVDLEQVNAGWSRSGCHPDTARIKWNREVNKAVMKCFYRSHLFDENLKKSRAVERECSENQLKKDRLKSLNNSYMINQWQ